MVCTKLPGEDCNRLAVHLVCEVVSDALFKFVDVKESVSVAVKLVNFFPDRIPVAWILAHQTGEERRINLL